MAAVATIGFGEAAQAFVAGWHDELGRERLGTVATFDIKVEDPLQRQNLVEACARLDVCCAENPGEAVTANTVVFSLVTADRALEAARRVAEFLEPGTLYLDCNSCSPATKMAAERLIVAAGATYVDVAVMSPVYPGRHRTPLLVSGAASGNAVQKLSDFGMKARAVGDKVGQASSIKMLRSVMIKGFEALTAECVLAARRAGVEEAVIASLQASDPGVDWLKRSAYNLERMMVHGKRRASEMREVAATLRELGLPDRMAVATAEWQAQIGDLDVVTEDDSLDARADSILEYFAR